MCQEPPKQHITGTPMTNTGNLPKPISHHSTCPKASEVLHGSAPSELFRKVTLPGSTSTSYGRQAEPKSAKVS